MSVQRFQRYGAVQVMIRMSLALVMLFGLLMVPEFAGATAGQWRWHGIGLVSQTVQSVAVDPTNASIIYAGTATNGVYKTIDGGVSWTKTVTGLTNLSVTALAIDPVTPATLYAGTYGGGVFKSTNSGASWSNVAAGYLTNALNLASSATLYAGTLSGGVYKSINSGTTWNTANSGMTNAYIWSLAIDPVNPAILYAGTLNSGIYKSTNGGTGWTAINTGLPTPLSSVKTLAVDPATPATLYAGIQAGGIYKSTNSGASWSAVNTNLSNLNVSRVAIDPLTPATLYAGTLGGGIFNSIDSGATWAAYSTTLTNLNIRSLAIAKTNPTATVYAGTDDGVFVLFQQPVDTTSPTGTIAIKGGASYTPSVSITLSLSAADFVGVTGYYLSSDPTTPLAASAGWTAVTETSSYFADVSYTLPVGDGTKSVYVWYKDSEGNVSLPAVTSISLDTTPPVDGTLLAAPRNAQVTLNWNGSTDAVSGIAGYTLVYSTVSEPVSCAVGTQIYFGAGSSFTHANLVNGVTYYYRLCATDNVGNISSGVTTIATPDATAPTSGILINGGAVATSNASVTLSLSATDAVGVTGYYVSSVGTQPSAGAAGWTAITSTTNFSANVSYQLSSGDGPKTVYVWYEDAAGNISVSASSQIIYDTIVPVDGVLTATAGNAQVALAWNGFSDAGSGITFYTVVSDPNGFPVSCNAGTQVYTGGGNSFVATGLTNGVPSYYRICATDNAGNISTGVTATATPDGIAPTGAIVINGGSLFTPLTSVSLALSATDDVGVTGYYLSSVATTPVASAAGWATVASTTVYSATVPSTISSGDGNKTIYVWYKDVVGNVSSAASSQIFLDTTPPVDGVVSIIPGDAQLSLNWNGFSDTGSGLAGYTLVYSTAGIPASCTTGTQLYTGVDLTFTHTGLTKGLPYYYRLCAADSMGNVSAGVTASAIADVTAPVGGIIINSNTAFTSSTGVTVALSATDDGGVTGYYLTNIATPPAAGAVGWVPVVPTLVYNSNVPFTLSSGDGIKPVYVWYKDSAGNVSTVATAQITLDTTPPVNGVLTATPGDAAVFLSWSGYSDAGSGLATYTVVFGAGNIPASCASGTQLYQGGASSFVHAGLSKTINYNYRVCATDNVGNVSSGSTASAIADVNAPVGGIIINSNAAFTPGTAVTVTMSATDDGGVTGYYLSNSATQPAAGAVGWVAVTPAPAYNANVSFTMGSGDGVKTIYAWFKDLAGNVSPAATSQITLDTTPPVNGVLTATPSDAAVILYWDGYSDAGSGVAGYTVVFGTTNAPVSCATGTRLYSGVERTFVHTGLSRITSYNYRVCATDSVGNVSTGSIASAIPDITAPVGGIVINGGAAFASSSTVSIALSATDDGGVTGYYLSMVATTPSAAATGWVAVTSAPGYNATVPFTLSSVDGLKTVYVWYKDVAGNISLASSSQISLDVTPPTNGVLTVTPSDAVNILSWSGYSDAGSGIGGYTVVFATGSAPVSCATGTQIYSGGDNAFVHAGLSKTVSYFYRVCAVDNVGNVSTGSTGGAVPDIYAPAGGLVINGGSSFTAGTAVTLALSATDDGGVTGYYLSSLATPPLAGATGWVAVTSTTGYKANVPFTLSSGDGVKTINVWYKDLAGNVSSVATSQITFDATPPVNGTLTATPGDTVITLNWTGFSDTGSGIANYTLVYGVGSVPVTCTTGTQVYSGLDTSFIHGNLSGSSAYYYRLCATDNAGNLSSGATANAIPDITAPVGGISINAGATLTLNPAVTLALSAFDDGGVTGYYLSTSATAPKATTAGWVVIPSTIGYNANVPFTFSSGDGTKIVYVWYKDFAGNISAVSSYQIMLDTSPPVDGVLTATSGTAHVLLSWKGFTDAGSGINGYTVVYDTVGMPASCAVGTLLYSGMATTFTHPGTTTGTSYYYRVCATDVAGYTSVGATATVLSQIPVTLTGAILGSGGGSINSATSGSPFSCSSGTCSTTVMMGTALTLKATPDSSSFFTGWSGDCTGQGDCLLTMPKDSSVTATFDVAPKVLVGVKPFDLAQVAYDDPATLNNSVIKMLGVSLPGALTAGRGITVHLDGGYNGAYTSATGSTVLQSPFVIKSGAVGVSRITIR